MCQSLLQLRAFCCNIKCQQIQILTRTTRTPAFWGYPPPPHDYPYHWVILDPKSKDDKVKVTNLKNSPKFQIFEFWNGHYTRHTFWSCLIRCANMKLIRWVLLKIHSGHDSVHRRTDGQGDTSIPLRWSGGYNYEWQTISEKPSVRSTLHQDVVQHADGKYNMATTANMSLNHEGIFLMWCKLFFISAVWKVPWLILKAWKLSSINKSAYFIDEYQELTSLTGHQMKWPKFSRRQFSSMKVLELWSHLHWSSFMRFNWQLQRHGRNSYIFNATPGIPTTASCNRNHEVWKMFSMH